MVFTITLSQASTGSITVKYATADGTATAGSDYNAASGTLTFAPGVTKQTVTIAVRGDTAVEGNEILSVVLSSPTGATIAASTGTGTIVNDDQTPASGAATFTNTDDWGRWIRHGCGSEQHHGSGDEWLATGIRSGGRHCEYLERNNRQPRGDALRDSSGRVEWRTSRPVPRRPLASKPRVQRERPRT